MIKTIATWGTSILLAGMFVMAGWSKASGAPMMVQGFTHWGMPLWFMYALGVAELAGAVGLLIPRLAVWASLSLSVVMVGAVGTHLSFGEPATTPGVLLLALMLLSYARRQEVLPVIQLLKSRILAEQTA